MAIVDNARRKQFQNCTSFDELGDLCSQYFDFKDTYFDEIIKVMPNLNPEISTSFFDYLLKVYYLSNTTQGSKSMIENGSLNLIKTYCDLLVNGNLLKEYSQEFENAYSDFIHLIIASASNHDNINIIYLMHITGLSEEACKKIFYDHDYTSFMNATSLRVIDILTSNAAYEDEVYDFTIKFFYQEQIDYLNTRSTMIYHKYIKNNFKIVDTSVIEAYDIYNYLTYLISSLEIDKENLKVNTPKLLFENAIRNTYDSIDMINLDIPIMGAGNYKGAPAVDIIKVEVLKAIIDEAFIFMKTYKDLDNPELVKYFKIDYDDNRNVTCYRVIPDSPLLLLDKDTSPIATEAYDKNSLKMDKASRKIYSGYKAYKDAENKVDSQLSKLGTRLKDTFTGHKSARDRIIEGEHFSPIRALKKIFTTAAIFSFSKIAGILFIITKHYCSNKVNNKERLELMNELELEMKLLDEKIEDARGDGNRQAKYSMMRTRAELQKAYEKIKYGLSADKKAINTAKEVISGKKSLNYRGPKRDRY